MEYVGEVIGKDEFLRRYQQKSVDGGNSHYYFLQLDKTRYIDAELCANMSRFMNHSCDPTCRIFRWMVGDDSRIGLFATRDLIAGMGIILQNLHNINLILKVFCLFSNQFQAKN